MKRKYKLGDIVLYTDRSSGSVNIEIGYVKSIVKSHIDNKERYVMQWFKDGEEFTTSTEVSEFLESYQQEVDRILEENNNV